MKQDRLDRTLEVAVNKGLAAALLISVPAGVKIMSDAGVPREVVARVLLWPLHRRATDWTH
jgi:hypothetical protein